MKLITDMDIYFEFSKYNDLFAKSEEYQKIKENEYDLGVHDFKAGAIYCEEQLIPLFLEFAEYVMDAYVQGAFYTRQELFDLWLKERNEKENNK